MPELLVPSFGYNGNILVHGVMIPTVFLFRFFFILLGFVPFLRSIKSFNKSI